MGKQFAMSVWFHEGKWRDGSTAEMRSDGNKLGWTGRQQEQELQVLGWKCQEMLECSGRKDFRRNMEKWVDGKWETSAGRQSCVNCNGSDTEVWQDLRDGKVKVRHGRWPAGSGRVCVKNNNNKKNITGKGQGQVGKKYSSTYPQQKRSKTKMPWACSLCYKVISLLHLHVVVMAFSQSIPCPDFPTS